MTIKDKLEENEMQARVKYMAIPSYKNFNALTKCYDEIKAFEIAGMSGLISNPLRRG